MTYRHTVARIHDIANAPKGLIARQSVSPRKRGSHGLIFESFVELVDGSFFDIRDGSNYNYYDKIVQAHHLLRKSYRYKLKAALIEGLQREIRINNYQQSEK